MTPAGTYYLEAAGSPSGDYTLAWCVWFLHHDEIAKQLTDDFWQEGGVRRAFDVAVAVRWNVDLSGLNEAGRVGGHGAGGPGIGARSPSTGNPCGGTACPYHLRR